MALSEGAPEQEAVPPPPSIWRRHRGAVLVGIVFVLLAIYYNVSIPLWESDNEWAHYQYARYLATNHSLPDANGRVTLPFTDDACRVVAGQAGSPVVSQYRQPPLYYILGALVLTPLADDSAATYDPNPFIFANGEQGGYNVAVHPKQGFPPQGTALAVHLLRALSGLIGLLGLVATYFTCLLIFRDPRLAAAGMAVNAFVPQYVFSSAVVNNDILVGALGSWCILFCVHFYTQRSGLWTLLLAMLAATLAILAKYTGIVLLPMVAIAVIYYLVRSGREGWAPFGKAVAGIAGIALVTALPVLVWLWRNQTIYGRIIVRYPVLETMMLNGAAQSLFNGPLNPLRSGQFAFITIWGLFGNDNLSLPAWILVVLGIVCLLALLGVALVIIDRRQMKQLRMLALLGGFFLFEAWVLTADKAAGTSEPRGRYLMPVFSTASFLLTLGIFRLAPARWKESAPRVLPAGLLLLSLAIPSFLLGPIYAPPRLEASAELLPGEEPIHAYFGDFAELVGYSIEPQNLQVWDTATVTLVWRSLKQVDNNYTVGVNLLDGAKESHGVAAHFPGGGNFATSLWRPGDVFRDSYAVSLEPSSRDRLPSLGQVKVSMYCYPAEEYVSIADAQGAALGDALYLGRMKWLPGADTVAVQHSSDPFLTVGDELALVDLNVANPNPLPGQDLMIDLTWEVLQAPARDYTVFAHLLDSQGIQVGGNDQPMTGGFYPTGLWEPGEVVTHTQPAPIPVGLPAGDYQVLLGVYDLVTGERLAVRTADGVELPDGSFPAAMLHIAANRAFLPAVQVNPPPNQ